MSDSTIARAPASAKSEGSSLEASNAHNREADALTADAYRMLLDALIEIDDAQEVRNIEEHTVAALGGARRNIVASLLAIRQRELLGSPLCAVCASKGAGHA